MQNPFSSSPFSTEPQFSDEPAKTSSSTVSRGLAPTRQDLMKRATELGVDPNLAISFFSQESSGNWNSNDSPRGARGGMQVMPGTYRSMMGTAAGQDDPWNNMEAGLRYIAYGQRRLGTKDPELLAAGYHAGYDHPSLRRGEIPNTNDGMISTRDYARSVAGRVHPKLFPDAKTAPKSATSLFSDSPAADGNVFSDAPIQSEDNVGAQPAAQQNEIDNRPYLDRLTQETGSGFDDMMRSLSAAKWAVGGGDDASVAQQISESLTQSAAKQKTTGEKENDAAFQAVTDAKGAWDTTVAGVMALGTAAKNYKDTSIEIARNAANSLPTIAGGIAGAGAGAGVGAAAGAPVGGVGAVPGAVTGAIWGGRAGMAAGTTATEMGAEVQDMVQRRLAEQNIPPTAQNVLAIISDKSFKDQALKQGLAKGLTVAAVDQLFMKLGGKVATSPARRIATQELAEQGVDVSTRAARNAALATPAGRAALEAAKPAIAARAGAGAAALGVDAAGESIGEGLSQKVARGEVDYGDALREGVVSVGQSAVEVVAGSTIEGAKVAAQDNSNGAQFARELQRSIDETDLNAPRNPRGPLERATEKAAGADERVTVTAPDGEVSGTVTNSDGKTVDVIGDDGTAYRFDITSEGIKIQPEQGPLSSAVEAAADAHAEAPITATDSAVPDQQIPNGDGITQEPRQAPKADYNSMTEDELRARLKYLKKQARQNGGFNEVTWSHLKRIEDAIYNILDGKSDNLSTAERKAIEAYLDSEGETDKDTRDTVLRQAATDKEARKFFLDAAGYKSPHAKEVRTDFDVSGSTDEQLKYLSTNGNDGYREAAIAEIQLRASLAKPEEAAPSSIQSSIQEKAEPAQAKASEPAAPIQEPIQQKPKTASKEDLEHLFGIDKKREKALERIAKGTAYFHDGVKAKDFIKKNGLSDTHEVKQGKGGRWDIVAKVAQDQNRLDREVENLKQIQLKSDRLGISINAVGMASEELKASGRLGEVTNGSNERTSGKPAGAEEVVEKADAGQGAAAAVQPAAKEAASETVEDIGRKDFLRGSRRDAPSALTGKDQEKWYAGYDNAAEEKQKTASKSRVVRTYTTRGGAVGAEIKENTGPDGKVSYSYNGKWGAGSGIDAESMRQTEAQWQKSKSGYTLKESGNADELENANNRGGEREQPAAEQAADVTAGREVREEGRGQEEVANVDALTRAESGSISEPAEQKPSTLMDRVKAAREEGGNISIRQNKGDVENGEATGGNDERGSVFGTNTEIGNVADLRRDAIGGITWRAKGITDDLVRDGVGQLVGQSAATPREVAAIAQIYRNPRFETARFVLTRGGKVVFETGATARLPGATNFFPGGIADAAAYLRGAMKRANADGYYMLHNHPSGDPTPSKSDIDYTRKLANSVKGFSGHVIINSNKYAVIDASGNGNVEYENFGEDMLLKASKPHKVIGYQIKTFGDVAEVGKSFQFSGYVTAIGVSGNPAKVRAVGSIDADSIGKDSVREFAQQSGSDGIYLFAARDDLALNDARKLMREGFINNAMFEDGSMVSSLTGDTGLAVLQFGSELKGPVEAGEGAEQKEGEQPAASRRDVTATEEFKKWFGDSKVVDAKGSPLVVYHGTNARFDTFDPDTSVEGGFFFTADKSHASGFGGNTVEAYLSLKNPLVVDGKDIPIEHELGDIERIIQRAKEEKHDGVFIRGFRDMTDTPADTYIVFEPTQIKSATGNNGDFDASNPDILASREGSIDPAAAMAYVEDNFWSILEELNDAKLVEIVC